MSEKKNKHRGGITGGFDRFFEALTGTNDEVSVQNQEEQEKTKVEEINKTLLNLDKEEKEIKISKEEIKNSESSETIKKESPVSEMGECQNIISTPKEFEDVRKIANFIKQNKVVTLNLEELDMITKQRVIDFLCGTIAIAEARLEKITKTVYIATPKNINVIFDNTQR